MNAQSTFFVSGPEYVSGDFFSTNTGNLGSSSQSFGNLYLTGTGYMDKLSVRAVEATTGQITGLSVSNLYPVSQPNLGHPAQKWNDLYLTGTGYAYSQEVIYNGNSEEVITRAEVTGRFAANYLTSNFPVQYTTGLVTGMTFSLAPNKTYKLEYRLQYSGSSTSEGISVALSGVNTCPFFAGNGLIDDFNNTPEGFIISGYDLHGHFHGATDRRLITLNVLLVNSPTTNSISLYAGKESSGINTVALCSGSWATMTQY